MEEFIHVSVASDGGVAKRIIVVVAHHTAA